MNIAHLNLPTVGDRRRVAVSDTWRVLLFDSLEEAEGAQEEEGEDQGSFEAVSRKPVGFFLHDDESWG